MSKSSGLISSGSATGAARAATESTEAAERRARLLLGHRRAACRRKPAAAASGAATSDTAGSRRRAISATCSSRPKIEAKPASPPMKPLPISMPIRPAPSRPPSKSAGKAACRRTAARLRYRRTRARSCVMPGAPGCVIERLIGAAAFGAVAVGGGAEKVFEPREPALDARTRVGVSRPPARTRPRRRAPQKADGKVSLVSPSNPDWGRPEYRDRGVLCEGPRPAT